MTTLDKTKFKQYLPTHQAQQKLLKGKVKAKKVNYTHTHKKKNHTGNK